ncbi:MAG: sulfite exporter TauE/SafE family protein [Dehalococcoidia bacterium]
MVTILGLVAVMPLFHAQSASAHPLGNFTINRYARLELYEDRVRIHYVVDMAEIPTFQVLGDIETDGTEGASAEELAAFARTAAEERRESFELSVDGEPIEAAVVESAGQLLDGQGGLQVLRLTFVYDAAVAAGSSETAVTFVDRNYAGRAGWKEIVVRPSDGATATVPAELQTDRSNGLLEYPAESLTSAPDVSQASFTWVPGKGAAAPVIEDLSVEAEGRSSTGFAGVFSDLLTHERSGLFILLSLLIAFAFGAQHALGPGHGKTMVAAYLVGSKGTPKQAAILGATVTATHTSTVYLLGLVTLVAAEFIAAETVYLWMGVVSGALVVGFGAVLFAARARSAVKGRRSAVAGEHRHGLFGKSHSHEPHEHAAGPHPPAPSPDFAGEGEPTRGESGHGHSGGNSHVETRSLLSLGVLGGLLPCPSAVVVMVAAISQGEVLLGMLLIVAFSLGLAGVLTAIGMSLVLGKRLGARQRSLFERPAVRGLVRVMPVVSALVVMLVGVGITYQAWNQPGL